MESAKLQVREALEEYGCFEACSTESWSFRSQYLELWKSISVDDAHIAENVEQRLTTTLWPQGNISFSKTMASFTQLLSELQKTIMRMILESFGVEKYLDELIDSTNDQLRANNIKVDGLEVQSKDGEWMNIKPSPNSIIVIIGDSLTIWLNGRLSSPFHRVMMRGNKTRYVIGLFARAIGGYQVKAPEELVDDKHPRLFKPFEHDQYLEVYPPNLLKELHTELKLTAVPKIGA
ncbi:hypothetical protein F3Y22_tig00111027pilonHSYRG00099 [Hibiscus syriacus]|uniref:Isopenicillin N synthase-like Fe(2+) 2OG dioxygenase domain-containing protein n=1 Tax=Hibiscus syriacus TaxID=106335 RepID=A0A6A2Z479_HIBSY|nr:hypothetical protein F3Y22_tig00111027pilonHSYRG00099 [Hibiscus syriacus]